MKKNNEKDFTNIKEIQSILLNMAKEVHSANIQMNKNELALMFRRADSIKDMAKYIVASQNAMQSNNVFLSNKDNNNES